MIRPVTSADRAVLRELLAEFYDTDAVLHPLPASYHDAALDELFRSDSLQRACLLEQDGETAGYGLLSLKYSHEAGGLELWVEELYVRPAFRGRGLGHEFFAWLRGLSAAEHIRRIRLETEPAHRRERRNQEVGHCLLMTIWRREARLSLIGAFRRRSRPPFQTPKRNGRP